MAYDDITLLLGGWDGFELVGVVRDTTVVPPVITLTLQAVSGALQRVRCRGVGRARRQRAARTRVTDHPRDDLVGLSTGARCLPALCGRPSKRCRGRGWIATSG